ncbi:hypothetical protein Y1Q_0010662 [Alligator mississippiensis]|uniref:Uncharacterized protein n=1 Tax=Alligator mississippiensis TaxID=8496 RepID=A0A151M6C8_ALLMI|nr:hypothetical protein Y1Q_0010662 [Alligator mississippiensis]
MPSGLHQRWLHTEGADMGLKLSKQSNECCWLQAVLEEPNQSSLLESLLLHCNAPCEVEQMGATGATNEGLLLRQMISQFTGENKKRASSCRALLMYQPAPLATELCTLIVTKPAWLPAWTWRLLH